MEIKEIKDAMPSREEISKHVDSLPYYGSCTYEYNEGFEEGINWFKEQLIKNLETININTLK